MPETNLDVYVKNNHAIVIDVIIDHIRETTHCIVEDDNDSEILAEWPECPASAYCGQRKDLDCRETLTHFLNAEVWNGAGK